MGGGFLLSARKLADIHACLGGAYNKTKQKRKNKKVPQVWEMYGSAYMHWSFGCMEKYMHFLKCIYALGQSSLRHYRR